MEDERVIPSDNELKRRLFGTPGVEKEEERESDEGDEPLPRRHREKRKSRRRKKAGFRLSFLAVLMFLVLCALALAITLHPHVICTWHNAQKGVLKFFSNQPLRQSTPTQAIFGLLGALPLALAIGVGAGAFTCLFMFYDSDVPGDFPPTPVSPRRDTDPYPSESRWHLGYIFVPVNGLVAFSLALFYLRLHLGLGIL